MNNQEYPRVGGRIRQFIDAWKLITNDSWILQAVSGYKIEFHTQPVQRQLPGKIGFSLLGTQLIDNEIQQMLAKGAIPSASMVSRQFVSNLFIIPKKNGSLRPVINLKPLNEFVQYHHFKMEHLTHLLDLLRGGEFLTTLDLKDAYFTIPIHEDHSKYLRFEWQSQLFEFICLPFGLSSAPRVFTKVMKPIVATLRSKGIKIVIYLDDLAIISASHTLALAELHEVITTLESLGFIINREKSQLVPSQVIEFLGFKINSITMTVFLSDEKVDDFVSKVTKLYNNPSCSIRDLASLIGLIISVFPAIRPAKLHFRELERVKVDALRKNQGNYDAIVTLPILARNELSWFMRNSHQYNGIKLVKPSTVISLTTDASLLESCVRTWTY